MSHKISTISCYRNSTSIFIGREGYIELGQVSCFKYEEYDLPSTFDIEKFEKALNYLIQRHETLRIIFPSDTEQKILEKVPYYTISIFDLNEIHIYRRTTDRKT